MILQIINTIAATAAATAAAITGDYMIIPWAIGSATWGWLAYLQHEEVKKLKSKK